MDEHMRAQLGKAHAELLRQQGADPGLAVSAPDEHGLVNVEGTLDLAELLRAVGGTVTAKPGQRFFAIEISCSPLVNGESTVPQDFDRHAADFVQEMLQGRYPAVKWSVATW